VLSLKVLIYVACGKLVVTAFVSRLNEQVQTLWLLSFFIRYRSELGLFFIFGITLQITIFRESRRADSNR